MSTLRTRWAAIGAAVAVTLGVGGIGLVNAQVGSGERTVLVPIEPCRLADTRATSQVGTATTIGENTSIVIEAHGMQGNCDLPTDATALSMNVTAVDPTAQTNLRIYPTPDDGSVPLTANLNPFPGLPREFNSVVTNLNEDGQFSVYNRFGTVDVVIDVIGYYADHNHDDQYYTKDEADAARPAVVYVSSDTDVTGLGAATVVLTAEMTSPGDGTVVAESVVSVTPGSGVTSFTCSLSTDATIDGSTAQTSGSDGDADELSTMTSFDVAADDMLTVNLVCESTGGTSTLSNPQLALTFTPAPPPTTTTTTTTTTPTTIVIVDP